MRPVYFVRDVPSPYPHPPVTLLLKTKAEPQFDRTVTERSKAVFGSVLLVFRSETKESCRPVCLCQETGPTAIHLSRRQVVLYYTVHKKLSILFQGEVESSYFVQSREVPVWSGGRVKTAITERCPLPARMVRQNSKKSGGTALSPPMLRRGNPASLHSEVRFNPSKELTNRSGRWMSVQSAPWPS
jgi:hypothetical protein